MLRACSGITVCLEREGWASVQVRNSCFYQLPSLSDTTINAILTQYAQLPHFLKQGFGFFQLSTSVPKILLCVGDVSNL